MRVIDRDKPGNLVKSCHKAIYIWKGKRIEQYICFVCLFVVQLVGLLAGLHKIYKTEF